MKPTPMERLEALIHEGRSLLASRRMHRKVPVVKAASAKIWRSKCDLFLQEHFHAGHPLKTAFKCRVGEQVLLAAYVVEEAVGVLVAILEEVESGNLDLKPLSADLPPAGASPVLMGTNPPTPAIPVPTREQLSLGWVFKHMPVPWWGVIAGILFAVGGLAIKVDDALEAAGFQEVLGSKDVAAAPPEVTSRDALMRLVGEGWLLRESLASAWSDGRAQEARAWSDVVHPEHVPASAERFLSDEGFQPVADPAAPLRDRTLLDVDHRLQRLREVLGQSSNVPA